LLRDLGSSLIPKTDASSARERILFYLRKYPFLRIQGDELMVVAGIGEWARRVRELRVQFGWSIISGTTAKEMDSEGEFPLESVNVDELKPDDYILVSLEEDRDAAFRWHKANEIRKRKISVLDKVLEFLRANAGRPVTGEELRYVAGEKTEWARRVRELRTEHGWPVATKSGSRPDLPVGTYVLEQDRQSPPHDRRIPDPVRRAVLRRDGYSCRECGWKHEMWNPSDPRHLEPHHIKPDAEGGLPVEDNLITLCTVCHDRIHSKKHD
jgi:hypothetical protein